MKLSALLMAVVALGCSSPSVEEHPCPPGNKLTYDNFGKDFFASYCVRCHGGPNGYSSRALNTVESIRASRERIFANAIGDNPPMPPGPDDPPEHLRRDLADWLACGAP